MQELQTAFSVVTNFFFSLNWVDWVIICAAALYMIEGYATGAVSGVFDIVSFLLAFTAGLKLYKPLGDLITKLTHMPSELSHTVGFVIAALLTEAILRFIQGRLTEHMRKASWLNDSTAGKANRVLGIIPGAVSGLILLAFLLTVLIVLPVSSSVKQAIGDSKFGSVLVARAQSFEKDLTKVFGGKTNDLLTFFTVEPQESGSIALDFKLTNGGVVDQQSENLMFAMVNKERVAQNLSPLEMDNKLRDLARTHSQDMLERGYFSHYTPEGKSPFDRMNEAGIQYQYAGENLAFSASVDLAMQGLMQSPGHRANILSPNFHKVGIGVIDGGIYGLMFSQEFTD